MPPLRVWPGLLPLARHYSSRKYNIVFLLGINIISLRRNCCLIVDSFEKNYREKKTRQGDKETGRDREETGRQGPHCQEQSHVSWLSGLFCRHQA